MFDFTVGALDEAGRHAEALETAEAARGRALADLMASRQSVTSDGAPAAASNRDAATLLTGTGVADAAPHGLDSPVARRALSSRELSSLAAANHSTIISYWVGADRSLVWVVRGDGSVFSATLPVTRTRLQQLVEQTRTGQGAGSTTYCSSPAPTSPLVAPAVTLTRLTREHAQVRMGASVRGAIDLVRLGRELQRPARRARATAGRPDVRRRRDRRALRPAAPPRGLGHDARGDRARADRAAQARPRRRRRRGRQGKSRGPAPGGAGRSLSGAAAQEVVKERGRRTLRRDQLAGAHGQLEQVSPAVGRLDEAAFNDLLRTDADAAVALLADLGAATDPQLRAQARRLAARLFVRAGRLGAGTGRGYRRLSPGRAGGEGDLDLDLTLEVAGGRPTTPTS